jgi:hypothetical protein
MSKTYVKSTTYEADSKDMNEKVRNEKKGLNDTVFSSARGSRISNYTSATHSKPLPFNAVRYIALQLKGIKENTTEQE